MNIFRSLGLMTLTAMLVSPLFAQDGLQPMPEHREFLAPMELPMDMSPAAPAAPMYSEAPAPQYQYPGEPMGQIVEGPIYVDSAPVPLFTKVKYVDKREMHPCAVTKIIRVNDPCARKDKCNTCGPKCVYIEICVPPCDCEEDIRCRRHGDRVRYDYGKYKVDVRVRKGFIVVDYQK